MALTRRQIDTLNCLSVGMSNRDIADMLAVSQRTVKQYIGQLVIRLSVDDAFHSRVVLGCWWAMLPELARIGASVVSTQALRESIGQYVSKVNVQPEIKRFTYTDSLGIEWSYRV